MTVLTDSDILIEVARGRDKTMVLRWLELGQSDALILYSAVTALCSASLWTPPWAVVPENTCDATARVMRLSWETR